MPNLLAHMTAGERRELFEKLNYLNLAEIRGFCGRHGIPYKILAARADGGTRVTSDADRKPIVLDRVRHYLKTGEILPPTVLAASIVRDGGPPAQLKPTDRIYYRWYNKKHDGLMRALASLAPGFRDGAVARVLIMEFWTRGEAPTLQAFAAAWIEAGKRSHELVTPEYAFLTDLQRREAGADWKAVRKTNAAHVMQVLDKLIPR